MSKKELEDVVIRFSGDSGDGMQLTGTLFSETSAFLGNGVSTFPDFPAEIRAPQGTISGVSGFQVHISSHEAITPGDYCDTLVAMNPAALRDNAKWLKRGATIIVDNDNFTPKGIQKAGFATDDPIAELHLEEFNIIAPDMTSMTRTALEGVEIDAKSVAKCKNMFALGICYMIYGRPLEYTLEFIENKFAKKNPEVARANALALKAGYNYASNTHAIADTYTIAPAEQPKGTYRTINGNQATAWGLIAASEKSGRSLFCGSYPITPATAILEELAKRKELGVKTLQAEDEIAGICTSIGAAFAGNFAVTTTSGPGLSLKSEAMGLAVMTELPLVVVDVQRAGPSTGMPTKTEQADLYQALWGRNGESPMVVMAAGTPSDCFHYAFQAGKIAMESMTPVLLLTDGFIANGSEPWKIPSMDEYPTITPPIITECPEEGFLPYKRDEKHLARAWALPGTAGLEHRIGGLEKHAIKGSLSHDPENHQIMVDTRAAKVARVANDLPPQDILGDSDGDLLVVSWGGTKGHTTSAVNKLRKDGHKISLCHIHYINPLPKDLGEIFPRFGKIVVCELNSGQLAGYLRMNFNHTDFVQYNKVTGQPFTTIELVEEFETLLKK